MELSFRELKYADAVPSDGFGLPLRRPAGSTLSYEGNGREDNILYFHCSGSRRYRWQDGSETLLSPHDVILMPARSRYSSGVPGDRPSEGYFARFTLITPNGSPLYLTDTPGLLCSDPGGVLLPFFRRLAELSMQTDARLRIRACLCELLDETCRFLERAQDEDWFHTATEYMSAHLRKPMTLSELAAVCGLSERTLSRRYRERTGQTPVAAHRAMRVRKAEELLKSGMYTLEATAEFLGFTDAAHLSRCFVQQTGVTPGSVKP